MESEFLIKLGLNDGNKWILDDGASQFFQWCVQNVDPDKNVITESKSLDIISLDFPELSETAAYELESKYPGILSINKESLAEKESYVKLIEVENNERKDRIIKLEEIARGEKYLEKLEKVALENEIELKRQEKEIRGKIKESEIKRGANIKTSSNHQLNSENFLFQLPNDHYLNIVNKICDDTNIFMRERFNVNKEKIEPFQQDSLETVLINEKNQLLKLSQQILDLEMNLAGINYVALHINEKIISVKSGKNFDEKTFIQEWSIAEENQKQLLETLHQELQLLQIQEPPFQSLYGSYCEKKLAENS